MRKNGSGIAPNSGGFALQFGNAQHQGARNYQEDAFGFSAVSPEAVETQGVLAALCDGMGGLSGGRETAMEAVSTVLSAIKYTDFRHGFDKRIAEVIEKLNKKIYDQYNVKQFRTGCTLSAVYIYENMLHWACVGDSRVYLVRGGQMYALNEDHDYMDQLLGKYLDGACSMDAVMSDPQKDNLASFIGSRTPMLDVSRRGMTLMAGDAILLCSDGIYNSISECEMLRYIDGAHAQSACDNIIQNIVRKAKPSQDNMTVMLIKVCYNNTKGKKHEKNS